MPRMNLRAAVAAIDELGVCLVFPLENRPEPRSLWSSFFPRREMSWDWDAGADPRVAELWHLRTELSCSGRVAYAKWYRGRATFFSLPVFSALVHLLARDEELGLSADAVLLYRCFEEESPLSTKEVKRQAELTGRARERAFERGMRELWSRLLVVGFGERDDGAFPSLLVGASKWLHEAAWRRGFELSTGEAMTTIDRLLPAGSPFRRELDRRLPARRPPRR